MDESARFAAAATERPHHAHAAEHFGRVGVDARSLAPNVAIEGANPTDPRSVREPDHGKHADRPQEESPIGDREDDQASQELDDRSPRVVEQAEDEVRDATGVLAKEARDAAGAQVVDPVERKSDGVFEHSTAKIDGKRPSRLGGLPPSRQADRDRDQRQHDESDADRHQKSLGIVGDVPRLGDETTRLGWKRGSGERVVDRDLGRGRGQEPQQGGDGQGPEREDHRPSTSTEESEERSKKNARAPGPLHAPNRAASRDGGAFLARTGSAGIDMTAIRREATTARAPAKLRVPVEVGILVVMVAHGRSDPWIRTRTGVPSATRRRALISGFPS